MKNEAPIPFPEEMSGENRKEIEEHLSAVKNRVFGSFLLEGDDNDEMNANREKWIDENIKEGEWFDALWVSGVPESEKKHCFHVHYCKGDWVGPYLNLKKISVTRA